MYHACLKLHLYICFFRCLGLLDQNEHFHLLDVRTKEGFQFQLWDITPRYVDCPVPFFMILSLFLDEDILLTYNAP